MTGVCGLSAAPHGLAHDILASTDCLIAERVQSAYTALLAPGGTFTQALTLGLTVYVAIVGYRLILGYSGLTLGELVPHFIKIGLVLALATSWPSYQVLVFNLLFHGPEQLANAVTAQVSDSTASGQADVLTALQALFDRITEYASDAWAQAAHANPTPAVAPQLASPPAPSGARAPETLPLQLGPAQFVAATLWLSALLAMAASVGVLLVVRIILAILLVLGPVFIACALFSGTRGLFEGWLRTTVKFAAVPLFTFPLTAALVATLQPFVERLDDAPIESFRDGPTLAILMLVLVFAAVLFQVVRLSGGIAAGIRLPRRISAVVAQGAPVPLSDAAVGREAASASRAAVMSMSLRTSAGEAQILNSSNAPDARSSATRLIGAVSTPPASTIASAARLGQGYRRLAGGVTVRPITPAAGG